MTQIKTAEQIAQDVMDANMDFDGTGSYGPDVEVPVEIIFNMITEALQADRKQRDLYELIAEALDERAECWPDDCNAARDAAEALRNGEGDEAWDRFIGPMLDEMEEEYGA